MHGWLTSRTKCVPSVFVRMQKRELLRLGAHTYNGIGNRTLLSVPCRLAVRISRRITGQQLQAETARYIQAAHNGAVLISPAISPGEKDVMRQVFNLRLPVVVVVRNGFTPLSKPKGEQFDACAEGLLLNCFHFGNSCFFLQPCQKADEGHKPFIACLLPQLIYE